MAIEYKGDSDGLEIECSELPIAWEGDVIVAGGGGTGIAAAIAAARNGAHVLLVEQHAFLGGMCAYGSGMPLGGAYPAGRSIGGVAEDILSRIADAGLETASIREIPHFGRWFYHDPEYFKSLVAELMEAEGVEVLLHSFASDVLMTDDNTVAGIVVQNKSGRLALMAKSFVDCTGDADLAARAGAPFEKGRETDGAMMAVTLPYIVFNVDTDKFMDYKAEDPGWERAVAQARADGLELAETDRWKSNALGMRQGHIFSNMIRIIGVDATDAWELSKSELEARKRIRQHIALMRGYIPGCENAYVGHTSEQMGIRDTRRIIGEDKLDLATCLECTKSPNTILRCMGPIDNVNRGDGGQHIYLGDKEGDWYGIPYGVMVPKGINNLLVAGRCFSSESAAQSGSRGQALLMGMGEAAATAAVLVANRGMAARDVDVTELQQILTQNGCDLGLDELDPRD